MNNSPDFKDCFNNLAKKKILIITTTWNKELLSPLIDEITKIADGYEVSYEINFCPGSLELAASIIRAKPLDSGPLRDTAEDLQGLSRTPRKGKARDRYHFHSRSLACTPDNRSRPGRSSCLR